MVQHHIRQADTMTHLPPAGYVLSLADESAELCLTHSSDRPATPDAISRFRDSYQQQPGLRFISTGLVGQNLPPDYTRYGTKLSRGDRVQDCMEQAPMTELQDFYNDQKEAVYHSSVREPLGKSYNRGHALPQHVVDPAFRFGKVSIGSENTKSLIYFNEDIPDQRVAAQAPDRDPRFHRDREVTRQIDRQYDWPKGVDPATQRFGKVETDAEENGVKHALSQEPLNTTIASKRVHEIRNYSHDRLGQARELRGTLRQLGSEFIYGKGNTPDEWGARKCIGGAFGRDEQAPDKDLGVSIRKLDPLQTVPHDVHHTYGVPSIRADIAAPRLRSVADPQNYGDEHNAKGLLYPSKFSRDGVDESEFLRERSKDEIRVIFTKMGYTFSDTQFHRCVDIAVRDFGCLSADSFRNAYNRQMQETATKTLLSPIGKGTGIQSF